MSVPSGVCARVLQVYGAVFCAETSFDTLCRLTSFHLSSFVGAFYRPPWPSFNTIFSNRLRRLCNLVPYESSSRRRQHLDNVLIYSLVIFLHERLKDFEGRFFSFSIYFIVCFQFEFLNLASVDYHLQNIIHLYRFPIRIAV